MSRRKDETLGAADEAVVSPPAAEPMAVAPVDGLLEVHMCGPGRELLEAIRISPERRRHKIAWQGHHYEHFDIIANDVWRYAQVD